MAHKHPNCGGKLLLAWTEPGGITMLKTRFYRCDKCGHLLKTGEFITEEMGSTGRYNSIRQKLNDKYSQQADDECSIPLSLSPAA